MKKGQLAKQTLQNVKLTWLAHSHFFSFHYLKRGPVKQIHSVNYFSTHKTGSISHPGPVKSQYKERADKLVAEAEAKLR